MGSMSRKLWTQGEIVQMGTLLGFKNFDRRSIRYWTDHGVFPEPVASVEGVVSFYEDEYIDAGLLDIARRMRVKSDITYEDIKWAKEEVLKSNRAKNISKMLRRVKSEK